MNHEPGRIRETYAAVVARITAEDRKMRDPAEDDAHRLGQVQDLRQFRVSKHRRLAGRGLLDLR